MNHASGTWTLTKEHERMIHRRSAKCFASSYKRKENAKKTQSKDENKVIEEVGKPENEKDGKEDKDKLKTGTAQTQTAIRTATPPL